MLSRLRPAGAIGNRKRARYFYSGSWWSTVGIICLCLLVMGLGWYVQAEIRQLGFSEWIKFAGNFGLIALWMVQYLLVRVRVDERGISRRILGWWELWPWEAFHAGEIQAGIRRWSYESPTRPWWRRRLELGYLAEADREAIDALIRQVWTPPPVPPVPDAVTFQLNWPDSRTVAMTADRLVVSTRRQTSESRWGDVREAEIWRVEANRHDFQELRLRLSDQELFLRGISPQGQENQNWIGASAAEIAAFVVAHAEPAMVRDYALHGSVRTLEQLKAREEKIVGKHQRTIRELKCVIPVFWGLLMLLVLLPLGIPQDPNKLPMALMGAMLGGSLHFILYTERRELDRRRHEFQLQRTQRERAENDRGEPAQEGI
jgi:hypothetical protein